MKSQVIILPIAWHQRKEESARILAAAETAEQLLAAAGITSRIDDTDNYTPGQKMKYWWVSLGGTGCVGCFWCSGGCGVLCWGGMICDGCVAGYSGPFVPAGWFHGKLCWRSCMLLI